MRLQIWKRHLAALGGAFLIFSALLAPGRVFAPAVSAAPPRQDAGDRLEVILANMPLERKVGQLFMVSLWGETLYAEAADFLSAYNPGGVILFGYNAGSPAQIAALTNAIQQAALESASGLPAWIAVDQEGGLVARLSEGFTAFPVNLAVAATGNPAYARAVGLAMAEELRAVGVTMNLAPVADVQTNPHNPVIDRRSYGSDPRRVAEMVAAMVEGLQAGGVLATAKHFPGHGDTGADSHLELPVVALDRSRLEAVELVPFRQAVAAEVGAIMAAHIWYPALDPTPDQPASLSPAVLNGLLRQEMGFQGLIMTDALDMDAIDRRYRLEEAAIQAIQAGVDLITPGPHVGLNTQRAAIDAVIRAVQDGVIPLARIEESVRRVLALKAQYGVLDWTPLDPLTAEARLHRETHEALVADILAAAVTLVYDDHDYIPLDSTRQVALIYPATRPSIARACETYHDHLRLVGISLGPTDEERAWAVTAAQLADVAVVFTQDVLDNAALQRLVRALPPEKTVVVALRSPYDWQHFPNVAAYLAVYSPLQPAIPAVCAALFGASPITGVLPVDLGEDLPAGSGLHRP